jgi:hypothetical protein
LENPVNVLMRSSFIVLSVALLLEVVEKAGSGVRKKRRDVVLALQGTVGG